METLVTDRYSFWRQKKVLVTGHTGFKGSWLCMWLEMMGAEVTGFALEPPTDPALYALSRLDERIHSVIGDVRDLSHLQEALQAAEPEIVFHMAAQPLVRESYLHPVDTFSANVMGTVHLLESVRTCPSVRAVVNVTTDKVYENREWVYGYRENERLGGYDPYSSSKACAEWVTNAYRHSFFTNAAGNDHSVAVATARAGNVIGGGDWAKDRLVPDIIRSLSLGEPIILRNPTSIRPWQHVLEPLSGYLLLAQKLYEDGSSFASSWNFGPDDSDARPVLEVVELLGRLYGPNAGYQVNEGDHPHEAHYLKLDCSKAKHDLGWTPRWTLVEALERVVEWTRAYQAGEEVSAVCRRQIEAYMREEKELTR